MSDQEARELESIIQASYAGYVNAKRTKQMIRVAAEAAYDLGLRHGRIVSANLCGARDKKTDEIAKILKDACDREWRDEDLRTVAVIASNAIYWRNEEIQKLRDQLARCERCGGEIVQPGTVPAPVDSAREFYDRYDGGTDFECRWDVCDFAEAYAAHRTATLRQQLAAKDIEWQEKWHAAVETGIRNTDRAELGKQEALALTKQTLDAARSQGFELVCSGIINGEAFYDFKNLRAEKAEAETRNLTERVQEIGKAAQKALLLLVTDADEMSDATYMGEVERVAGELRALEASLAKARNSKSP